MARAPIRSCAVAWPGVGVRFGSGVEAEKLNGSEGRGEAEKEEPAGERCGEEAKCRLLEGLRCDALSEAAAWRCTAVS